MSVVLTPFIVGLVCFAAGVLLDHLFGQKALSAAESDAKKVLADIESKLTAVHATVVPAPKVAPAPVKPATETESNTAATVSNTAALKAHQTALEAHGALLVAHAEVVKATVAAPKA